MAIFTQNPGFGRGEIAPELRSRADITWHRLALLALRNRYVSETGGAPRRPGTVLVDECRYPTKKSVGIPFIFSTVTGDTYPLEFGDFYMEVIRGGARVCEPTKAVTMATNANPCVFTVPGHGYAVGDHILTANIPGLTLVTNRRLRVRAVIDANRFSVEDLFGNAINTGAFLDGYTDPPGGGTVARVYKIATPYAEADLAGLAYAQSFDVMTIVHPKYPPMELRRTGHTAWTLTEISFASKTPAPEYALMAVIPAGTHTYKYKITAIDDTTGEESPPCFELGRAISAITQANPAVVTIPGAALTYQNGDHVRIRNVVGMTQVNNRTFIAKNVGANTLELEGVDSTGYGAYVSGGTLDCPYVRAPAAAAPTPAAPLQIFIRVVANCHKYPIYREENGVFGYVGTYELPEGAPSATTVVFKDVGAPADSEDGPPIHRNPFVGVGNYPSAVAFHQQRRIFGGSDNAPHTLEVSQKGDFSNFSKHEPIRDSDAFSIPLATGDLNPIRQLVSMRRLHVMAGGVELVLEGDSAGSITPTQINARPYSYEGSGFLRPLKIGNVLLFVQARGWIVRDLVYDFGADGYKGQNRSLPSRHLLEGYTLVDWAYQKVPHSIVWAIRDDGALLGFTYMPEQEMYAWHRHDMDGAFERVVSVPEGDGGTFQAKSPSGKTEGRIDGVYFWVKRTINGQVRRFIERLDRGVFDALDRPAHKYLDSSLSYDGWHKGGVTLVLSNGINYTSDETLTLTASAPNTFFASDLLVDDNGKPLTEFWMKDPATDEIIRLTVVSRLTASSSVCEVRADRTVPIGNRNTAVWAKATRRVSGLGHLEGKQVAALGDGFVLASPYNPSYPALTVTQGRVLFPGPARAVIHVGLPYVSDLETLKVEVPEGQSLAGKPKRVANVGLHIHEASGAIWCGLRPKDDDGKTLGEGGRKLQEFKDGENPENPDVALPLRTEFIDIPIAADWEENGSVLARVVDPVPGAIVGTVLSMAAK